MKSHVNNTNDQSASPGFARSPLVETTIGRYNDINGPNLLARSLPGQRAKATVGVAILNRMQDAGRPNSVRNRNMVAGNSLGRGSPRSDLSVQQHLAMSSLAVTVLAWSTTASVSSRASGTCLSALFAMFALFAQEV